MYTSQIDLNNIIALLCFSGIAVISVDQIFIPFE